MEAFDLSQIDDAVNDAFGAKKKAAVPVSSGDSQLSQRLDQARAAYRQQYGKDMPISSGPRSREEQQRLFDASKAGAPNVYMPVNPANQPGRQTFHQNAVDIPTSVPEDFLNQFGIHRPLGKQDPVHAVAMPANEEPSASDTFNPERINSAVNAAFSEPPKETTGGKVAAKASQLLREAGAGAANIGDILYSPIPAAVGLATYAGARQFQTPEEAAKTQQKVVGAIEKPFGIGFGIAESPEYKAAPLSQLMDFIGKNVDKGADWIARQTGISKQDADYYVNMALAALPGLRNTRAGQATIQAAKTEAGYLGGAVKAGVEKLRGPEGVKPAPAEPAPAMAPQTAPYAQIGEGHKNAGAAATTDPTMIRAALETATPEFKQLYGNMPLDKVNTPTVMRHLEGDSLPIPIRLTKGQASGDLVQISKEQNVRGRNPEIAYQLQQQNQALVDNVPAIRERVAPDVYSPKTIDSSTAIMDSYRKLDQDRSTQISQAYKALEDANGGQFPVDGQAIVQNADRLLAKKLKTNFVPPEIAADLNRFREGEPMTFEQFEAMRTNLAAEIRKAERSGDGNRAAAAGLVRQAMEELPLTGDAAALKPLADKARTLARDRFQALEKDPAYRAVVNDTVPADKFFDKFVINGHNKNVRTMVDTLGIGSEGHQHMAAGTINWLSDRAGIVDGRGNFSQANFNKALKKLDDTNNLQQVFTPEGQTMLRTLGNVANYTQFQPRGSFVNNSNTLTAYLAEKGASGLETGANVLGLKTIGYPVGSEAKRLIGARRERKFVKEALEPGAGSTLEEISKKGKKKP
jgi:hypothetical protein